MHPHNNPLGSLADMTMGEQPQAPEIEQVVIGALMLDQHAIGAVSDFLAQDHFFVEANAMIYSAITALVSEGVPIDLHTVAQRLKKSGTLAQAGGAIYLSKLVGQVSGAANIQYHARIIVEKFMRRKLIETCVKSLSSSYDDTIDVFDLMDRHNAGISEINAVTSNSDPTTVASVLNEIAENREQQLYIHFGMGELDNHVAMGPGCVVVIGARPAVGKSTMVMNALINIAMAGHKSLFLSLEMNDKQLGAKVGASITGIDSERMSRGELSDIDRDRLAMASIHQGTWTPRILIQDLASLKASQVHGIFDRAARRHGCKVVVIDYLQLMDGEGSSPVERMSNISKACKQAAKATGLRLIELSQLKRRDGAETNPEMSDLRESGQIEADGDIIMLLGREMGGDELMVKIAKNKMGPIGVVRLPFNLMNQRIGANIIMASPQFPSRSADMPPSAPNPDQQHTPDEPPF